MNFYFDYIYTCDTSKRQNGDLWVYLIRSASNPMDKGACNFV